MRKIAFLTFAVVLGIAGVVYAVAPFTVTIQNASPPDQALVAECSAPIRQVIDPPTMTVMENTHLHNAPTVCKDSGRTRMLTSLALWLGAVLAAIVALSGRRGVQDSEKPSLSFESSSST